MVEGFDDLLGVGGTFAEEIADEFLFLGVDAENRIAHRFVELAVVPAMIWNWRSCCG